MNLDNTGLIDVRGGALQRFGSDVFTQVGTLRVADTATFRNRTGTGSSLTGQGFTNAGTISGGGIIDVGAGYTLANAGLVAPGDSAGTLTVTGNFNQATSGTLAIEVGGA